MSDEMKKKELMDYLNANVFEPAIAYGKANGIPQLSQGARYTRMRMSQLDANGVRSYFWSAITGTERSINFSKLMKANHVIRFEDVMEEFREKFNDEWLKQ